MTHNNDKHVSDHKQELKNKIVQVAMPMFKRHGIKAVRMDDVAKQLQISKRTLYEAFEDKEQLLVEGVRQDIYNMHRHMTDYSMTAENELDIVVTYFRYKFSDLQTVSPLYIEELKKYSKAMNLLKDHHEKENREAESFLKRCIDKGFFDPHINYNIINDVCENFISSTDHDELFAKYSVPEIFRNFFLVLLKGFCTEIGLSYLKSYLEKSHI